MLSVRRCDGCWLCWICTASVVTTAQARTSVLKSECVASPDQLVHTASRSTSRPASCQEMSTAVARSLILLSSEMMLQWPLDGHKAASLCHSRAHLTVAHASPSGHAELASGSALGASGAGSASPEGGSKPRPASLRVCPPLSVQRMAVTALGSSPYASYPCRVSLLTPRPRAPTLAGLPGRPWQEQQRSLHPRLATLPGPLAPHAAPQPQLPARHTTVASQTAVLRQRGRPSLTLATNAGHAT